MPIRNAEPKDAAEIAKVHITCWQQAYSGILPPEILANLDFEERLSRRQKILTDQKGGHFVAIEDNKIVGFSDVGSIEHADSAEQASTDFKGHTVRGIIYTLYILEDFHGKGIGKALFNEGQKWLKAHKLTPFVANVVVQNTNAIGFYEHLGGRYISDTAYEVDGIKYPEKVYLFP